MRNQSFRVNHPSDNSLVTSLKRGITQKPYLVVTLENTVRHEALLDTAADITLMSIALFNRLKTIMHQKGKNLKLHLCSFNIQPYTPEGPLLHI